MHKYLIIIFILITSITKAQKKTITSDSLNGLIVYDQKIDLREYVEKPDTLKFNRTKSIFFWNLYHRISRIPAEIQQNLPGVQIPKKEISLTGQVNFYDTAKDSIYSKKAMRILDKFIYLKEKTPSINWSITDSTKQVGNYTVQKATALFRGRQYTAWFAPEIPVPFGPWKLHGLPGLILEAYDESGNIYFSATEIKFMDAGAIGPIQLNGEEEMITLDEYKEIMNNFRKKRKANIFKRVRGMANAANQELPADIEIDLPEVELLESFEDSTDQ